MLLQPHTFFYSCGFFIILIRKRRGFFFRLKREHAGDVNFSVVFQAAAVHRDGRVQSSAVTEEIKGFQGQIVRTIQVQQLQVGDFFQISLLMLRIGAGVDADGAVAGRKIA